MGERVVFQDSRGLRLIGVLKPVKTDKIIIMSHGFTGDKDEEGRFVKAAGKFSKAGFAVLRFDFAGSGESDFTGTTVSGWVDDLRSAIKFVKQRYKKIGLLGLSQGGLCSILSYDKQISTLVLWAPVTKAKTPGSLKDPKIRKELEKKGWVLIKNEAGKEFRVEKEYLTLRESINQQEILSKIKCPVLIIHGNKDDVVPSEHSKTAMNFLPKGSKLEILENAGHSLEERIDTATSLSTDWFKEHLK